MSHMWQLKGKNITATAEGVTSFFHEIQPIDECINITLYL